jgi:hypothetical protein
MDEEFFDRVATGLLELSRSDDNSIIKYLLEELSNFHQILQTLSHTSAQGPMQEVQGYYRVTVSAHGLDEQSFEPPLKNVQATFMFQQPGHSFSAFACSRPISGTGSPSYCDFRTRVFRCMSHIIFSSPASYDPSMLKDFQQGIFQSIYSKELAAEPVTPDPTRFGPKSASSFGLFDYTLNHEKTQIHRKYDLTPTSVSPTVKNQLEYANSERTEVWLVPGISVSAELIDMCEKGKNDDFGLEVVTITSRYGVFVDVYIPGTKPMYDVDIFVLLEKLSGLGQQFRDINQKKKDADKYKKYVSHNDAKIAAGNLAEYLAAYIPDLGNHETSSGLLNSVLRQLEADPPIPINTTSIPRQMTIADFLSKYNGNLYPKLNEGQISQILSLNAAIVLNDDGYVRIHGIVQDRDTATKLLKFIRKVFIIYEFSKFITKSMSPLSITSDQIIAILAEYHKQKTKSADHHISIDFLDQTCRDCGINKCEHAAERIDLEPPLKKAKGGGTRRKKQKTKKTNKGRKVRGKKPQFRTARKRKYRSKINYTYT